MMQHMASGSSPETTAPVVIRVSPMAHLASGFLALGLLVLIPVFPAWGEVFLVIPILASVAIVRLRTVADRDSVTARSLLGSRTVGWDDIEGLRFTKSKWARAAAQRRGPGASGGDVRDAAAADRGQWRAGAQPLRLSGAPAPLLQRVVAVQEHPGGDAAADAQ